VDPYRLWDMEVFSTLLWHLQQDVELSFLAQELLNINPQSPQAWIAIGNLFSLKKERNQALTCFHRAVQLDPNCAYAYTLMGHESIDEDLEKAITFFQSALRADTRHYNAWYVFGACEEAKAYHLSRYGLGTCYLRMSKIRLAEYHYRKSVEIHPKNAVLLGCVGMVSLFDYCPEARVTDMVPRLSNGGVTATRPLSCSIEPWGLRQITHWCGTDGRRF